jgi:hypothetical protein
VPNVPQASLRHAYHRLRNHFRRTRWLLGDEAQVEARFIPYGDSANLNAR